MITHIYTSTSCPCCGHELAQQWFGNLQIWWNGGRLCQWKLPPIWWSMSVWMLLTKLEYLYQTGRWCSGLLETERDLMVFSLFTWKLNTQNEIHLCAIVHASWLSYASSLVRWCGFQRFARLLFENTNTVPLVVTGCFYASDGIRTLWILVEQRVTQFLLSLKMIRRFQNNLSSEHEDKNCLQLPNSTERLFDNRTGASNSRPLFLLKMIALSVPTLKIQPTKHLQTIMRPVRCSSMTPGWFDNKQIVTVQERLFAEAGNISCWLVSVLDKLAKEESYL